MVALHEQRALLSARDRVEEEVSDARDRELRVALRDQFGQAAAAAEERLVCEELGREDLIPVGREIEGRADVGEGRERDRPEDGYAVLKVAQKLRVAARQVELAVYLNRVAARDARERAERLQLLPQRGGDTVDGDEVAERCRGDRDVSRG